MEGETAAGGRAVTVFVHWGRTEHRLRALRYPNHFLTLVSPVLFLSLSLSHTLARAQPHTRTDGKDTGVKVGRATAADRQTDVRCSDSNHRDCFPPRRREDKLLTALASPRSRGAFIDATRLGAHHTCIFLFSPPHLLFFFNDPLVGGDAARAGTEVATDPVELRQDVKTQHPHPPSKKSVFLRVRQSTYVRLLCVCVFVLSVDDTVTGWIRRQICDIIPRNQVGIWAKSGELNLI